MSLYFFTLLLIWIEICNLSLNIIHMHLVSNYDKSNLVQGDQTSQRKATVIL